MSIVSRMPRRRRRRLAARPLGRRPTRPPAPHIVTHTSTLDWYADLGFWGERTSASSDCSCCPRAASAYCWVSRRCSRSCSVSARWQGTQSEVIRAI